MRRPLTNCKNFYFAKAAGHCTHQKTVTKRRGDACRKCQNCVWQNWGPHGERKKNLALLTKQIRMEIHRHTVDGRNPAPNPIIYRCFFLHPRLLFGISEPSTIWEILDDGIVGKTQWSHLFWGMWMLYLNILHLAILWPFWDGLSSDPFKG